MRLVQAGHRRRHHLAQNICARGITEGPEWKDVQRLLKGIKGNNAAALRARAVLFLLAVYGLRSGEITRLLLSDFDWRSETFTVNHSKRGGAQKYPLQREVGDAILEYIQKARPRYSCRNLFLTLKPPYRAIGSSALWKITSRGMQSAGIRCRRRGPHSLRHACATHLLEQGASLKEIGDLSAIATTDPRVFMPKFISNSCAA